MFLSFCWDVWGRLMILGFCFSIGSDLAQDVVSFSCTLCTFSWRTSHFFLSRRLFSWCWTSLHHNLCHLDGICQRILPVESIMVCLLFLFLVCSQHCFMPILFCLIPSPTVRFHFWLREWLDWDDSKDDVYVHVHLSHLLLPFSPPRVVRDVLSDVLALRCWRRANRVRGETGVDP